MRGTEMRATTDVKGTVSSLVASAFALTLLAGASQAMAHGDATHAARGTGNVAKEQKAWGIAGDAKDVARTVRIRMKDTMRFQPERLAVRLGDTVRFVVHNDGKVMHELVIGTLPELEQHAALMRKFPDMEHDEPYMAHVAPGKRVDLVWKFNRPGEFHFACLIAGHFEAGMKGDVVVAVKQRKEQR